MKKYKFWITKEIWIKVDAETFEILKELRTADDTLCKVVPISNEYSKAPSSYWIVAPVDKFEEIEEE